MAESCCFQVRAPAFCIDLALCRVPSVVPRVELCSCCVVVVLVLKASGVRGSSCFSVLFTLPQATACHRVDVSHENMETEREHPCTEEDVSQTRERVRVKEAAGWKLKIL